MLDISMMAVDIIIGHVLQWPFNILMHISGISRLRYRISSNFRKEKIQKLWRFAKLNSTNTKLFCYQNKLTIVLVLCGSVMLSLQ